jgi:uncharacterized protein (DUF58 family)
MMRRVGFDLSPPGEFRSSRREGLLVPNLLAAATFLAALLLTATPGLAVENVTVTITPSELATSVGTKIEIEVGVTNDGAEPTGDLALHIDITDPTRESSVDPEDWVPELTKQLRSVDPGATGTVRWTLNPIAGGDFTLFAVAVERDAGLQPTVLASSNAVPVRVAEARSLNPGGVFPLVLGVPTVLGGVLAWRNRPRRRLERD